ncbi:MAG: S10 family peptidase [Planctomycetaceae bacterium]
MIRFWLVLLAFTCPSLVASAQDDAEKPEEKKKSEEQNTAEDNVFVTQRSVTIGGETIEYTATAGEWVMKNEKGEPQATVFFIAYTRDGVEDLAQRPLTFAFNGGPGSSSVWLHLGLLGPRRVKLDDADPPHPLPELVPNEFSILDRTDLVFIDPVSTGYSRPTKEENKKDFHGYDEDLKSVGEFIRLYVTRNGRWLSPKFLAGESYGTLRAAGLAGHLLDEHNMELEGIALISSVLDFATIDFEINNDLPYILFLPAYAATAWYHGRLPSELQDDLMETLAEVERFALGEYATALLRGADLSDEERQDVAAKVARYTGLSPEFVLQSNLRVSMSRFGKELLRDERRTVGRFDSRYVGIDRDAAGDSSEYDPSAAAIFGPYTATLNEYLRTELGVEKDIKYEILTPRVRPWSYDRFENRYVNSIEPLREAMTKHPRLQVFVASGYYDLATPYFASEYTFNHLGLDPSLRKNVSMSDYRGGHMMYVDRPSLAKLKEDLDRFYEHAVVN